MIGSVLFAAIGVACAMGAIVGMNRFRHEHRVAKEIRELLAAQSVRVKAPPSLSLPPPVERYLRIAVRDHAPVRTLRIYHGGTFRPRRGSRAFSIRGMQVFTADPPGFVWTGSIRMAPGIWIDARDMLANAKGSMRVLLDDSVLL